MQFLKYSIGLVLMAAILPIAEAQVADDLRQMDESPGVASRIKERQDAFIRGVEATLPGNLARSFHAGIARFSGKNAAEIVTMMQEDNERRLKEMPPQMQKSIRAKLDKFKGDVAGKQDYYAVLTALPPEKRKEFLLNKMEMSGGHKPMSAGAHAYADHQWQRAEKKAGISERSEADRRTAIDAETYLNKMLVHQSEDLAKRATDQLTNGKAPPMPVDAMQNWLVIQMAKDKKPSLPGLDQKLDSQTYAQVQSQVSDFLAQLRAGQKVSVTDRYGPNRLIDPVVAKTLPHTSTLGEGQVKRPQGDEQVPSRVDPAKASPASPASIPGL